MSKFHINKLNLTVIGATILTCAVCYKAYEPNAYEVYINGKSIAYVNSVKKVEEINENIVRATQERFGNININSSISYNKITVTKDGLSSDEDLKNNMITVMSAKVPAVEMIIDGKNIGLLANEKEGEAVINLIAHRYLSEIDLEDKKYVGIKNKVTYKPTEVLMSSVSTINDIAENILKLNENKSKPFLTLEFIGKSIENAVISYSTTIKWTNTMKTGQSKVETKGVNGIKAVEKQITFLNQKEISTKVIKESILEQPKNEVVLKGSKDDSQSTLAMYVPSRGSVSSNFGMRWGRMHEGIDIAAAAGTPIYAALDGKVVFAGWQSGYGYVIKLSHNNSIETVYGHCSKVDVKVNDIVKKGQVIGKVGSTGNSTGPHLHFEVKVNGEPRDPAPYIFNKQKQ